MTTREQELICGETAVDLIHALQGLESHPTGDGMAAIGGQVGEPAVRAIMRLEAELLVADADAMAAGASPDRTYDQRRADALILLFERLASGVAGRRPEA